MIYRGDDMRLCSDHASGMTFTPVGQTPVVRDTGQHFDSNRISAITKKSAPAFMMFQCKIAAPNLVAFWQRLLKQLTVRIYLLVDGHPRHRFAAAMRLLG
ncbi:MAG: transposase [Sulfuricaulis sp.]